MKIRKTIIIYLFLFGAGFFATLLFYSSRGFDTKSRTTAPIPVATPITAADKIKDILAVGSRAKNLAKTAQTRQDWEKVKSVWEWGTVKTDNYLATLSMTDKNYNDIKRISKEYKKEYITALEVFTRLDKEAQLEVQRKSEEAQRKSEEARLEAQRKSEEEYNSGGLVFLMKTMTGYGGLNGQISGTVVNQSGEAFRYASISFILYDSSGAQVGTALANIANLESGARWNFKATTFGQDFSTYKLGDLSGMK